MLMLMLMFLELVEKFANFKDPNVLLTCSQDPNIGLRPEQDVVRLRPPFIFIC
jgi:hypothetical protein